MNKSILQINKREVELEGIKLINKGLLMGADYYLEALLREVSKEVLTFNNMDE